MDRLESVTRLADVSARSNNCVPVIAVNGAVGTVKLAVYTAVPTTTRKFVINP